MANREGGGTRTVAVLGLGRTDAGDFLSSEDMEVLGSLAGYIGIAIQNAQLYRRLEQKIGEFERLKEFHENIVESIHIGVFAVDSTTGSRAGTHRWRRCTRGRGARRWAGAGGDLPAGVHGAL